MSLYLVWYLKHLPKKNPKTEQNEFPSRMSLGLSQKDNHRRISYLDAMRLYLQHSFPTLCPLPNISVSAMDTKDVILLCVEETMVFFLKKQRASRGILKKTEKRPTCIFSSYFYYCCCCQILWCGLKLGQSIQSSVCLSVAAACQLASSLDLVLVSMQQISSTINPKMMITKHILSDQIASPVSQPVNQPAIRPFHPISSRRFRLSVISRV